MDAAALSKALDDLSDAGAARRMVREVHTLKGVRGVVPGEVARVAASAWKQQATDLDRDEDALAALFSTAFEDGLLAIALLAAAVPDAPDDALEIGLDLLDRVDDHQTADALGWLVLGPARLASGRPLGDLLRAADGREHASPRRAVCASGLALTPEIVKSPSAAALRERLAARQIRFVDDTRSDDLGVLCTHFVRDDAPSVRKILRRVVGAWAVHDPEAATAWAADVRGGIPKMIREELERCARTGRRRLEAE